MYRIKSGQAEAFITEWNRLADTFRSLKEPPLWGTLVRHGEDRTLFYSFGPWLSTEHVKTMREDPAAGAAFARLRDLCTELQPGDYEVVTHIQVRSEL